MTVPDPPAIDVPGCTDFVEVGRGGYAVVYRARQESFDRDVAVKVINRDALSGDTAARFVRECRAIGALSWHPNVVTVHDAGTTATGRGYLVMAWLDGGSLADELAGGPLPARRVMEIGVAIAGALEATHRADRLHRDVKPENILNGPMGDPQLADFGIAAVVDQKITVDGQVAFSPSHVPPEVIEGHEAGPASDIYSLASTLYTLLAGRAPFDREGDTSMLPLLARIGTEPPPDLRPSVPAPLWDVIAAGLAKDPLQRPATAAELAHRLRRAAAALGWDVPEPVLGRGRRPVGDLTVDAGPPPLASVTPAPPSQGAAPAEEPSAPPARGRRTSLRMRLVSVGVGLMFLAAAAAMTLGTEGLTGLFSPARAPEERSSAAVAPSEPGVAESAPATPRPPGGDAAALLADGPAGYQLQPATQQLQAEAERGTQRFDPDGRTVVGTATAQVLKGQTPVAVAIAYGLTAEAANPLVVEDRIVSSALDPGASRQAGEPPTWRGEVTGTDGEANAAAVILAGDAAVLLLGSDQQAIASLAEAWRGQLR